MKSLGIFYLLLAVLFFACKKDPDPQASSNEPSAAYTSALINEEGYFCTPVSGDLEAHRLYGEYRLYEVNNSSDPLDRRDKVFYFMPDDPDPSTPNEFVITGSDPFTGNDEMVLNDFVNCRFEPAPEYPDTKIIFDPADPSGDNHNIRMWVIQNCTNLHFRDLNIYVRWDGTTPSNGLDHAGDYNTGLISITENNTNILLNDNHIQGSEMSLLTSDPIQDMIYEGGIRVGVDIDNGEHGYSQNTNICLIGNYIEDFRIYGISANDANNVSILNDTITKIWEYSNTFKSEAGGIHLTQVQYCDIANNYIRSVYSIDNDGGPCDEQFQHGIYVSKFNHDIHVESNEIRWISGAGLHITPGTAGSKLENIHLKNNLTYYCANEGILVRDVDNIEIINNNIYHCGYRISASSGLPEPCMTRTADGGVLDLKEVHHLITNLVMYGNRIKNNHVEMYDPATSRDFHLVNIYGKASLFAQVNNSSIVNSNHMCLENYNTSMYGAYNVNQELFYLNSKDYTGSIIRSYINLTVDGHCVSGSSPCTSYTYPNFGPLNITPNCTF